MQQYLQQFCSMTLMRSQTLTNKILPQLCWGVVTCTTPKPQFKWHSYSSLQKCKHVWAHTEFSILFCWSCYSTTEYHICYQLWAHPYRAFSTRWIPQRSKPSSVSVPVCKRDQGAWHEEKAFRNKLSSGKAKMNRYLSKLHFNNVFSFVFTYKSRLQDRKHSIILAFC